MFAASVSTLSLTLRFHRQDYVALPDGWNPPLMIDEGEGALATMIGRPLQELARPIPRTLSLALAGPRLVLHFEGGHPSTPHATRQALTGLPPACVIGVRDWLAHFQAVYRGEGDYASNPGGAARGHLRRRPRRTRGSRRRARGGKGRDRSSHVRDLRAVDCRGRSHRPCCSAISGARGRRCAATPLLRAGVDLLRAAARLWRAVGLCRRARVREPGLYRAGTGAA